MNSDEAVSIVQDLERLMILKRLELLDSPTDESFDRFTRLASQITRSPISLVSLVDANRQFFKSQVGLPEPLATIRETPLTHSFCKHVVAENAPLVVQDARKHPVLKDNLAIPDLGVIAYLGMPLETIDGVGLGSFCIIDTEPRQWSADEIEIMYELAYMVMTEIELRAQIKARTQAENALKQYVGLLESRVTERTHELQHIYHQLQKIDQLKSKFIDDISHELRTPVSNIMLYLDLLARSEPENRSRYEDVLRKQSRRLAGLLDGILAFADLQKSLEQPEFAPIDVNAVVKEVIASFEHIAYSRNLELSCTLGGDPVTAWGDATQFKQVIIELLQNALAYTSSGYVHIGTEIKDESIQLTVEDSGMGMDMEEITHCFRRFYRGKQVGQLNIATGAGLGLAKVQHIVAFHEGRVDVASDLNRGSTFTVYMPSVTTKQTNHLS